MKALPHVEEEEWPWLKEPEEKLVSFDATDLPLISVIIPSYNQGKYIEQTLRSIFLQGYPRLECIVMDGGSTDGTIEILKKYDPWITYWKSERDNGQSAAINEGFDKAVGDLIGWQNSDDYYFPNAFHLVAEAFKLNPDVSGFFGDKDCYNEEGKLYHQMIAQEPDQLNMIPWPCFPSEALFFRNNVIQEGHRINEEFHHYLDHEFFWRIFLNGMTFRKVDGFKAFSRSHKESKQNYQVNLADREAFLLYKMLMNNQKVGREAREKLKKTMISMCHKDFICKRYSQLVENFEYVNKLSHSSPLGLKLRIKYLIGYLMARARQ
jgi:glycosyltransferase involved in cell wall biosynthesis